MGSDSNYWTLINALVHADHRGQGGVVIVRYPDRIELSNPGSLLVSHVQLLQGGGDRSGGRQRHKVSVHERNIAELVDSMAQLLANPPTPPRRSIGFLTQEELLSKSKGTKGKADLGNN